MKLLVRLAKEHDEKVCNGEADDPLHVITPYARSFAAGFLKTREMAAEIASWEELNTPYKITRMGEEEA